MSYTPGPWKAAKGFPSVECERAPHLALCNDPGIPMGEKMANARLIASAPELVEELEKFVRANAEGPATEWVTRMCECDKSARALLARIRGEK